MPSIAQVGAGWFKELEADFDTDWFRSIRSVVAKAYTAGTIRPEPKNIFRALRETQPDDVKVVILGQDPYPSGGHADGLAFSSQQKETPKSLEIIYRDLKSEYPELLAKPTTNDLTGWAKQGVLLLNTALTVIDRNPTSHSHIGWDKLIKRVFEVLAKRRGIVYIAWGGHAKQIVRDNVKNWQDNLVLTGIHPAAEAYSKGGLTFKGRLREANDYLIQEGKEPIRWIL